MAKRICLLTGNETECREDCFNCDCGGKEATEGMYVPINNVQRVCSITGGAADTDEGEYLAEVIRNNLERMVDADVQSTDRVAELESLLKACERELNYLLDSEIDNSSTRHHVASLLDQIQLRVSGDIIRSLCKRCKGISDIGGYRCLTCKSGSHFENAESGE